MTYLNESAALLSQQPTSPTVMHASTKKAMTHMYHTTRLVGRVNHCYLQVVAAFLHDWFIDGEGANNLSEPMYVLVLVLVLTPISD